MLQLKLHFITPEKFMISLASVSAEINYAILNYFLFILRMINFIFYVHVAYWQYTIFPIRNESQIFF